MRYTKIVRAIYKKANHEGIDHRDLVRRWIMLFEETRVTGWSRDAFLDECIRIKEEQK